MQASQIQTIKMLTRPPKCKNAKTNNKKNITPDTVSEIQTNVSDQNTDTDENESDSMAGRTSQIW